MDALGPKQVIAYARRFGLTQEEVEQLLKMREEEAKQDPVLAMLGACKSSPTGDDNPGSGGASAIGVGGTKMKVHRAAVAKLFERNDQILDAEEVFALARTM